MSTPQFSGWIRDEATLARYLAPARIAHFGVATKTGGVALTTTWFDYVDGGLRVTIATESRKAKLLGHNPQATVVVDDGLDRVRGVAISGVVTLTSADHDEALLAHCLRYSSTKDEGERMFSEYSGASGLVVHLQPEWVRSWDETTDD